MYFVGSSGMRWCLQMPNPHLLQGLWVREFFWQSSGKFPFHRKTNLAAFALTGLVTALFIVLTILDKEPQHQAR